VWKPLLILSFLMLLQQFSGSPRGLFSRQNLYSKLKGPSRKIGIDWFDTIKLITLFRFRVHKSDSLQKVHLARLLIRLA
jgi:hypothetical protein